MGGRDHSRAGHGSVWQHYRISAIEQFRRLRIADVAGNELHLVGKTKPVDQLPGLVEALPEFPSDCQAQIGPTAFRDSVEREIQAFVGTHQTEEQQLQCRLARERARRLGEIIEHRVRKHIDLRLREIRTKLGGEIVIVGDVPIGLRELPEVQLRFPSLGLMVEGIVDNDAAFDTVAPNSARNPAERRSEKEGPRGKDEQICAPVTNLFGRSPPTQWIDAINREPDLKIARRHAVFGSFSGTWIEKLGILATE